MSEIVVCTTLPNEAWPIYGQKMLQSFVQAWPKEIKLIVQLDNDLLLPQVQAMLRPTDSVIIGWSDPHGAFVTRNKDKDSPTDYRKQSVRFCHKVFCLKFVLDSINNHKKVYAENKEKDENLMPPPRYLIWMDADVLTARQVTLQEIKECLPKEGDAVSYMGRKDWPHSECGWLAFDVEKNGGDVIDRMIAVYVSDEVYKHQEWHDSWIFDKIRKPEDKWTNLTDGKPGMDIWPQSPMGKWSRHFKGPEAKMELVNAQRRDGGGNLIIQTRNSIPHEKIRENIRTNQLLITNWIEPCKPTEEELVIVSAGPQLISEDVLHEVNAGRKIVAVKNALVPLAKAGIKPWACILLDPRPHVTDFVKDADSDILWFVASQVDPEVTKTLIERGCTIWGYHAAVNAGEEELISKQGLAVVIGGSATATRGLYVLNHLGFRNFRLYGYDLCYPDKVDLKAVDDKGQPKFLEISLGIHSNLYPMKKIFRTEPQHVAQYEEIQAILNTGTLKIKAFGQGIVPFIVRGKEIVDLRSRKLRCKLSRNKKPISYQRLLKWNSHKTPTLLTRFQRLLPPILHRQKADSNSLKA